MGHQENASPTMRMYGSQQRLWRQRAGISRQRLGEECGYSEETVKSVEVARRLVPPRMVQVAEDLCGAGGLLQDAADKIVRSKYPDWFEDFVQYEAQAVVLGMYENHVLPGLFQTEEYARAVFRSEYPRLEDEQLERRLAARLERQQLLTGKKAPLVTAVMEQASVERAIGGAHVMKGQITHLLNLTELRTIDVQIMPTRRESHAGLAGPLYVLETGGQMRLAYSETHQGSVLISDSKEVADCNMRYGMLRSQAWDPEESLKFLRDTLGEL
ncbi:helix-turn-helix transcriptional regulator [Streptomyces sp. HNM0574]|uniref:helix-turn-helix domain-containing protein n=1 Tax=Streptomyces sp. HNM0574 TaxID=2714954 RepID=UPI00146A0C57|nr:helix-turn-helix transcriptional regulator [Streptomyces sp. HNM0574]NLU67845.1 helix-turn-helix domain-containing protein [Streptomyces sp. HNM0574]